MTRTADRIETLLREDPEMEAALEALREVADDTDGALEWADVNDHLTSGQWGRLIEQGVLIDEDEGFHIADREAVDEALGTDIDADVDIDDDEASWSQWDKLAALGALGMMVGYWLESVRNTVGSGLDMMLGPLDAALPFFAVILVVSLITGLYSTLLQANLMNPERIGKYQERMQAVQDKRKELKEEKAAAEERGANQTEIDRLDEELQAVQEEQMEAMAENLGMFKEQFRPMVWIMLLTIPFFLWMYWKIQTGHVQPDSEQTMVFPIAGVTDLNANIAGPMPAWIVWYFLCSMGFTQLLRKSLDIDMTPT